ncbi:MAG: diacylglycerol kinase family lipid kinase [Chitinophagaceae bacterium]|nr:MAG: diacylglycerol kinase family lipid kinase [Chitinophagaceae bacterium]
MTFYSNKIVPSGLLHTTILHHYMKCLFIVNPGSGAGQKDWEELIREHATAQVSEMDFYRMNKEINNHDALAKKIEDYMPDRVIAAGGDGTVKMAAEVVMNKNIPLGILPAGSANGMAKELEIPLDPEAAILLSITGNPQPLDLVYINGEYCIHLSDMGLNAGMLEHFEESGTRGFLGYTKALFKMMGRHQFMRVTLHANNRRYKRKVVMAVIANASKYGTGAVINPDGKVSDGEFEVVLVKRLGLFELLAMIVTGKPLGERKTEVIRCKRMKMTTSRPYPFQIDGESREKVREINAVIESGAVMVVRS